MIPPILIFLVLLMVPLRVSAMELFGDQRNRNTLRASTEVRENQREATETDQGACRVGRGYGVTGIKPMTVLPLPLIEPDLPICSIRLSEAFHRFAS